MFARLSTVSRGVAAVPRRMASTTSTVASLESRWASMTLAQREAASAELLKLQTADWTKLSMGQKRDLYFLAFGSEPKPTKDGMKVFLGTFALIGASVATFYGTMAFGKERNKTPTRTPEWQEASNQYAKANNMSVHTGISSPGYQGKGFVE
ncbi:cytochrome c oxidase subunit IV [Fonticula alba]|uniref:Cytochrome c oxidase subunit IV n=1 Tax=Fonticula alba TaxID=691883 RepID=A0A058ZAB9_FONAL|nr:cytochrome c oxidase subunit IV [Fonticula alba]KCV70913.1 cytochrome c oxidase subunit IV [Fonticula alba]|eukprot:XP_009494036.1 cytochrome c oxidase subunit IV [Fonticula alba]